MTADVPHSPVNAAIAELERLKARLTVKCQHPNVEDCARLWAEDANHRQLTAVDPALGREFPFGCDTVEHVATALLAARNERDLLRIELDRFIAQAARQSRQVAEQSIYIGSLTAENSRLKAALAEAKKTQPRSAGRRFPDRLGRA